VSGREDDDERGERPKLSWSELDKRRDRPRSRTPDRGPRGAAAEARSRSATKSYLAKLDDQLFAKKGSSGRLADAVRDALGTPGLTEACRAHLASVGPPRDAGLIAAFLDAADPTVQGAALAALAEEIAARRLTLTSGLRAQLRRLADGPDDELAERAEEILAPRG
jgi:hypothetical protein